MSGVTRNELIDLATRRDEHCVSIYMTASAPGAEGPQNTIRWKNLVNAAEERLVERKLRAPDAKRLLRPASELIENEGFWQASRGGVAAFLTKDNCKIVRLDGEVKNGAFVSDRFVVRPLLPSLETDGSLLLLALSQNEVKLYRCTLDEIEPVHVAGLPGEIQSALNYDEPEPSRQVHTAMRGVTGKEGAVFHGQGGAPDEHESELEQFLQMTNDALEAELKDERTPLVVVAVDSVYAMFRKINRYPYLVEENVHGNADHWSVSQLHEHGRKVLRRWLAEQRSRARRECQELLGSPRTCSDVDGVLLAAAEGKVATLFIDNDAEVWGTYDASRRSIEIHQDAGPGEQDLVELAAIETLRNGGDVYAVDASETPGHQPAVAVCRY